MQKLYQNQVQKQVQRLEIKPKMLQTLKMMQMPIMEFSQYLKEEFIKNPLLEVREADNEKDNSENEKTDNEANDNLEELDLDDKKTLEEASQLSEALDDWNSYSAGFRTKGSKAEDEHQMQDYVKDKGNLEQIFYEKLEKFSLTENEQDFAEDLIESTDPYGFLPKNFDMQLEADDYNLTPERAEEILQIILHIEPKGICARNMEECLSAQINDEIPHAALTRTIIEEFFDDLIHKRYQKIASNLKITKALVYSCKENISHLDPKPGLRIHSNAINYITPDVIIKKIDGKFEVIVNEYNIPNINISRRIKKILEKSQKTKENVEYVKRKINSAKFLIKSIYMRHKTLENVTKLIIKYQHDYFYNESGILKPLTYATIAQELQVNESTISRVVSKKYANTPFGVKCLKEFFTTTAGKNNNYDSISKQQIQKIMLDLIKHEDTTKPLSDKEIVDIIKEQGIKISRRVIAKYRKALGILNSRLRRKN